MKKVEWTDVALAHLVSVWDFIAADSMFYANKVADEMMTATEKLAVFPKIGRVVPEIGNENVREILYMSYRIMYEIRGNFVYITQVVHGAIDFKSEENQN